jgi:protein O-mannosyl-transferase
MSQPAALSPSQENPEFPAPRSADSEVPRKLILATILLLTFAAYAPTLRFDFVHDDRAQIMENPSIKSWKFLPQYFTHQVWAGYAPGIAGNYYRPVFLLWLRLNDMAFGLHPWGWHLTTILLHLLTTLLVYMLAERLIRDRTTAGIVALLFGLHPVHIEAVAWVSGLTEPLMAIFFILAFLCHLQTRENPEHHTRWKALALLFFVAAILEKETAIVLPLLVAAYEWVYPSEDATGSSAPGLARRASTAIKPALPYFLLIIPYLAARIVALKGFSHPLTPYPFTTLLMTSPFLFSFWLRHLFWPVGLGTHYDYGAVEHPTLENFVLPAIATLVIFAIAFIVARRSRVVAFSLFWVVLPLLPLMDIRVFARNEFAHDRYLYVPSVGFVILAALALRRLPSPRTWRGIPAAQAGVLVLLVPLMGLGVVRESAYFSDSWTFYQHCARTAPHNGLAMANYAAALGERGRYPEALQILNRVAKENPDFWFGIYNLALTNYRVGQMTEAEENFKRAIHLDPNVADEHLYMGLVQLKTGRTIEAEASVRRALGLDPHGYGNHFALGIILKQRGEFAQALQEMGAEVANHPENGAAREQIADLEAKLPR